MSSESLRIWYNEVLFAGDLSWTDGPGVEGRISLLPPRVTLPWRKRPWKMRRSMLGLLTVSSSHPVTKAPPSQCRHLLCSRTVLEAANDTGARQLDNRGDPHPKE